MAPSGSTMLETSERARLLEFARLSIARGAGGRHPEPAPEDAWSPALLEPRATFTTLTLEGELRGCCGTIEPQRALVHDVWHNAWASAYADPRFWPVSATELASLAIAISVLTPLEPIAAGSEAELIASLESGVDGLVLRCGTMRATFLPAVWESLPDPREFVAHLKRKAGLPAASWPRAMAAFRYRTETFRSGRSAALAA
jgi:AmmeMemoRadiSam system protein A